MKWRPFWRPRYILITARLRNVMDYELLRGLTISDALTLIGFAISAYAAWKAKKAGDAAEAATSRVVERQQHHEEAERLRKLIDAVSAANTTALHQQTAGRVASAGRQVATDLQQLRVAQNLLATTNVDMELGGKLSPLMRDVEEAIEAITTGVPPSGWKSALTALQSISKELQAEERRQRERALRDHARIDPPKKPPRFQFLRRSGN